MAVRVLEDVIGGPARLVGWSDGGIVAHTFSSYDALPAGQLAVVPGASHGLPLEQPDALADLINRFLAADEAPRTFMPVRRARPVNP